MPNKFPSTNCFVITYIYVDARIYRFSPCTFLVIVIHRLHLYSFSNYVIPARFSSDPPIPTRCREEKRGKRRKRRERKARDSYSVRIESNRIESCRVSRSGERNEEEKESVRFLHAFLSEGGKYAKEHRGRCIPGRKEGALFAKSNNRDALSNVTGTTREHFFPANERNMARLEVRI